MPEFKLLYFKSLLDVAFIRFFDEYNDCFQNINGQYVLSKDLSVYKLVKLFKKYILEVLLENTKPFDILHPTYYLIIGGCMPKNNLLLEFKDNKYFPKKLDKFIHSDYNIKYLLKEKDIKIDLIRFNNACLDVFDSFFNNKILDESHKNIIFVQHNQLDCYVLFKVLKKILGRNCCFNFFEEKFKDIKSPLVAINDLIDKYINKRLLNKSQKLTDILAEIKQYISSLILR